MTATHGSLSRRLLTGAAIFISVALVIAAVLIAFALHRFIQGQIDQRLDTHLVFLSSTLAVGDDGTLSLSGNADGPPFDRPKRGWYWQVNGPTNVLRARALEGNDINVPARRPLPPPEPPRPTDRADFNVSHPAPADGIGPGQEPLHYRIVQRTIGNTPVMLIATSPKTAVIRPLWEAMLTLGIALVVLAGALTLAVALQVRLGLRPLERLRRSIADVRTGQTERLPSDQPREIGPLVTELNELLEQNTANLERARRHVANLAHGLKTPLATLAIALSRSGAKGDGEQLELVTLMERRIRHHLSRARVAALSGPIRSLTPVASRLKDIGDAMTKIYAEKHIKLTSVISDALTLRCEQQDFDEMAGNILDNAFRWARSEILITVEQSESRMTQLIFEDDGPGLPAEKIPLILRPGARADESAPGFGFGLPIAVELAELYGGNVELGTSSLGGLRVAVKLPS